MGIRLPSKIDKNTERSEQRDFYVPDGTYLVKVSEMSEKDRNDGNGTYTNGIYEIIDCDKSANEKAIGLKIFDLLSMTDAAMWRVVNLLDACFPPKFEGEEIPNEIEGKWMVVKVKNETYQGKENLRVKQYHSAADWEGITIKTDGAGRQIIEGKSKTESKGSTGKPAPAGGKRSTGDDEVSI